MHSPKTKPTYAAANPSVESNKISKLIFVFSLIAMNLVRQCLRQLMRSSNQHVQKHVPKAVPVKDFHNKLR